jgi:hypothetical protein
VVQHHRDKLGTELDAMVLELEMEGGGRKMKKRGREKGEAKR